TVPVRRFGCCHKQLYDGNRERWIWDSLQGKNEVLRGATRSGRKGNAENWSSQGDKDDFYNELNTISEARHKNLVKLEGWCCHINAWNLCDFLCWYRQKHNITFFLVYELVRNGNLDDHLYGKKGTLQWPKRFQIVIDITSALVYLYHECHTCISCIETSNQVTYSWTKV
ncbi:Os07g0443700, partial [Oryza sativa Japonica Group]